MSWVGGFAGNSRVVFPLLAKRHSCGDCPRREGCPWMKGAAAKCPEMDLTYAGVCGGSAENDYGRRRRADFFVRKLLGVEPRWQQEIK